MNRLMFTKEVVQTYLKHNGDLGLIANDIDAATHLDFAKYGDTFFEIFFTGGRCRLGLEFWRHNEIKHPQSKTQIPESIIQPSYSSYNVDRWINIENCHAQPPCHFPQHWPLRHPYFVLNCESTRQSILPHVDFARKILRGKPFLVENLERVLQRFMNSLMKLGKNKRKKLAIFIALSFSQKLPGVPPETIFQPLLDDYLVAKGISLSFITDVFKEYLVENSLQDLIKLLRRAKIDDNLFCFFSEKQRNRETFSEHFSKEGIKALAEYYEKKILCMKLKGMKIKVTDLIVSNADASEVIEAVKQDHEVENFQDSDVIQTVWDAIMDAVVWSGKNQKQDASLAFHQVKTWSALFNDLCASEEVQLELINKIQQYCYEDDKFTKLFPEIIRLLYDQDVLVEDTIRMWFQKGTNPRGRQTFVKSLEPFVKWLDEAEEE